MTIQRMDHLAAARAFFVELGLELQGEGSVEGGWVGRVVGLKDVQRGDRDGGDPDGNRRLELTRFHAHAGRAA